MLSFDQIIPRAAQAAQDKPILAAPFPLPEILCKGLAADGLISGYVADVRPAATDKDSFVAGWWIDRAKGIWFLRNAGSRSLILLSGNLGDEVGGRMLLEARLKGVQRILFIAPDGTLTREIDVEDALMKRLMAAPVANPVNLLSYDDVFDEMDALIGDRLRLTRTAFAAERVLIITDSLQPGGAQRQAAYTASELSRRFPGQIFLGRARSDLTFDFYRPMIDEAGVTACMIEEADDEFSSPELIDIRNKLGARFSSLGALSIFHMIFHHAVLIRNIRPRVVHAFQDYSNVLAGIAANWVGVPRLILSGRSVAPDNFALFQPYMKPAYRALQDKRPFTFLNNSDAGAADYARWLDLPRDRFQVLRNGFTFPEITLGARSAIRKELGVAGDAIVVGTIIRFGEEKRPMLWIESARTLHATHPHVRFILFGDGAMLEACRQFVASKYLSDVIKLPGLTNHAWDALSAMDIFVLTSRMEGLPNVLVEAQAVGLPVVCTGEGGVQETFVDGRTGIYVSSPTADALAGAVARLVDDPLLRRRMGAEAQKHARDAFGIERMIESTLAAYREAREADETFANPPEWGATSADNERRLGGITKDEGASFLAKLPEGDGSASDLWEDSHQLGPIVSSRQQVVKNGAGRYQIDGNQIRFSTSDATDPRFNGRSYGLRLRGTESSFDDIFVDPHCIMQEVGHCFIARLNLGGGSARFRLWESGARLGPGHCQHDDVRDRGGGRYSVWGTDLYFSTSDNSDPRSNGRTYILRRGRVSAAEDVEQPDWLRSLEKTIRHLVASSAPRDDFVPGRIVHVNGSLGPGGAERQLAHTLVGLAKHGFESIQLLCYYLGATRTEQHDFFLPVLREANVPVRTIRREVAHEDVASMPRSLRALRNLLPAGLAPDIADLYWEFKELRPEIVHAWLDVSNVRAGLAAALAGVPTIILAGRNANPSHFNLYEPYMDPAYKALIDLPQVTMLNNSYAGRDDYARWLGVAPTRIQVVHNGREFPEFPNETLRGKAREQLGISRDAIVIGTISRFAEEKQPHLFVDMSRTILERCPQAEFVYFGGGGMYEEVQARIASMGLEHKIRLPGITDDVWTALAAMDVFALTSRMEGLPNVLIEAQGAGVPVVCTAVGGMTETYLEGKSGIGVPSATAEALAAAALRLIDDPDLRQRLSREAIAQAHREFSVERMIERTLQVYRRATDRATRFGTP
jgi:glycosyltransferase involved in cell wall biosynthesis